jgi:hypothetical protein
LADLLEVSVWCGPKKALTRHSNPGFICAMKSKTTLVSLAVWLAAGAVCFASPYMGTWKLNAQKSKLARGMGRNNTVMYEAGFFKVRVTVDGVDAKGKPIHSEWAGNFDGKDYALTGDPDADMRSYTKTNDYNLTFAEKKGGKTVLTGKIAIAADGKSRTVTTWSMKGKKKVRNVAVYDKA